MSLLFLDPNVDEQRDQFSDSKNSASGCFLHFAWFLANFSLVLLIKVLLIKKASILFKPKTLVFQSFQRQERRLWTEIGGSSPPEVFLGKGVLKKCRKFTGEHPWRSLISIKFQSNFTDIALRHGCSPINLLHIYRTPFPKNTPGGLLLNW